MHKLWCVQNFSKWTEYFMKSCGIENPRAKRNKYPKDQRLLYESSEKYARSTTTITTSHNQQSQHGPSPFQASDTWEAVAVGLLCGEVVSIWFEHNIHLIFYSTLIADSFTSQNLDRQFDLCTLCLILLVTNPIG